MSDIIVKYQERQTIHEVTPRGPVARVGTVEKTRTFKSKDKKAAIEFIKTQTLGNEHGHDAEGNYRPTILEVTGLKKEEYSKAPAIQGGKKAAADVARGEGRQSTTTASDTPATTTAKKGRRSAK